jgi:hypothetical protein
MKVVSLLPMSCYTYGITGTGSGSPSLSVKIVPLVDRSDLFKVSNLVHVLRKSNKGKAG